MELIVEDAEFKCKRRHQMEWLMVSVMKKHQKGLQAIASKFDKLLKYHLILMLHLIVAGSIM